MYAWVQNFTNLAKEATIWRGGIVEAHGGTQAGGEIGLPRAKAVVVNYAP